MRAQPTLDRTAVVLRLAAVALLLVCTALVGGPASAEEGDVTWGVRTAANDQGEVRQNYAYEVDPGASITDAIVVTNHGAAELVLSVYAADGFSTDAGELDVLTAEHDSTGVGAWLTPAVSRLTVPGGASVEVPFTLVVPQDATPGDHVGAVVTSLADPDRAEGISVDRRLGIRVVARVAGDLRPGMVVEDTALTYAGSANPFAAGSATLTWTVVNAGNTRLSGEQYVTVAGPFGWFRRDVAVDGLPELLPGESRTVRVAVPGVLPVFRLTGTATVEPTSPVGDAAAAGLAAQQVRVTATAVPWSQLVVLALVVGAGVGTVLAVRRSRRRRAAREEARVAEAVSRALHDRDAGPAHVSG